jgi:UDP-N-acetylmuramoylalanine--D-glutamate ligase
MPASNLKIAILGYGAEGQSFLRYVKRSKPFPQAEFWILDHNPDLKIPSKVYGIPVKKELGKHYSKSLEEFSIIVRSPGIPFNLPEIQSAIQKGVTVTSTTKLFFELCPTKIIGITGTKGKSTTSSLMYTILAKSGFKTLLAGNIGTPALDVLPEAEKADFVVLELSSFQLQDLDRSPDIAVVLDVFPDHLDAHKSIVEYLQAKGSIARHQKSFNTIFGFSDNQTSKDIMAESPAKKVLVTPTPGGVSKNFQMVEAVTRFLRCPEEVIRKVLDAFKGLEHRLEFVRTIKVASQLPPDPLLPKNTPKIQHSISFYNDSAATNPSAAAFAVSTLDQDCNSLILIAGGKDKNLDYKPLADALKKAKHASTTILFGENRDLIKRQITGSVLTSEFAADLSAAIKMAHATAKAFITEKEQESKALGKTLKPLTVHILLSPASASFDMFKNFYERGKTFKKIVGKL